VILPTHDDLIVALSLSRTAAPKAKDFNAMLKMGKDPVAVSHLHAVETFDDSRDGHDFKNYKFASRGQCAQRLLTSCATRRWLASFKTKAYNIDQTDGDDTVQQRRARLTMRSISDLFKGRDDVHGYYGLLSTKPTERGKRTGKAATRRLPVTPELWQAHLEGRERLGIVPVLRDGTCWWFCIDVDHYQETGPARRDRSEDRRTRPAPRDDALQERRRASVVLPLGAHAGRQGTRRRGCDDEEAGPSGWARGRVPRAGGCRRRWQLDEHAVLR
jgi:hypothetical protein